MEENVILCPHETIISKSRTDFDTQLTAIPAATNWKAHSLRSFAFQFASPFPHEGFVA